MKPLDAVAAGFGILAVFFNARQIVWGWPIGLVNVGLYTWIFYHSRLYALSSLQIFFAAVSIYGWYQWLFGGANRTQLKVSRASARLLAALVMSAGVGTVGLGLVLQRTQNPSPFVDSGLTVVSLIAQWMMARKYLECWVLWVLVNVVSTPFFFIRGEVETGVQYLVFLGLAVMGLRQWSRSYAASS